VQVLLQIIAGPATGRRFRLRQGQIATVGRTEWSDFSVPDAEMADVHFQLQCDAYRCLVRRVDGKLETQHNGAPVDEARVRDGDRISAGATVIRVMLDGAPDFDPDGGTNGEADAETGPAAEEFVEGLLLSAAAQALFTDGIKAEAFLDALVAGNQWEDAVRFLAGWLPRPQSVAWGCECLEQAGDERLSAPQRAAVEAARTWAAEPTEENRRGAQSAAEALGGKTPAGWLALAAFWSEGSIGPPDAPEIPVVPGLSARAVGMAVTAVAGWGAPATSAADAMRAFLQAGRQMLDTPKEGV
jgi:predicted component of type VI protein secretion system